MTAAKIIILIDGEPDERGSHLTYAELEAWVDGRVSGVERELTEGHFTLCGVCRDEAADLARVRDSLHLPPIRRRRAARCLSS